MYYIVATWQIKFMASLQHHHQKHSTKMLCQCTYAHAADCLFRTYFYYAAVRMTQSKPFLTTHLRIICLRGDPICRKGDKKRQMGCTPSAESSRWGVLQMGDNSGATSLSWPSVTRATSNCKRNLAPDSGSCGSVTRATSNCKRNLAPGFGFLWEWGSGTPRNNDIKGNLT